MVASVRLKVDLAGSGSSTIQYVTRGEEVKT